jgi:hypothetical protein
MPLAGSRLQGTAGTLVVPVDPADFGIDRLEYL